MPKMFKKACFQELLLKVNNLGQRFYSASTVDVQQCLTVIVTLLLVLMVVSYPKKVCYLQNTYIMRACHHNLTSYKLA